MLATVEIVTRSQGLRGIQDRAFDGTVEKLTAFYFRNASIEASGTLSTSLCIFFCEKTMSR